MLKKSSFAALFIYGLIPAFLQGSILAENKKFPSEPKQKMAPEAMHNNAPLMFEENKGQITDQNKKVNASVLYQLALPGMNVSLKKGGFAYDTYLSEDLGEISLPEDLKKGTNQRSVPHNYNYKFHRIDVDFTGASPDCRMVAQEQAIDYSMYYNANTTDAGARVNHYRKVVYRNLYPGIDAEFVAAPGTDKPVEYNFIVQPGADIGSIRMRYSGALESSLKNGRLLMKLAHTSLAESIPASWMKETGLAASVQYKVEAETGSSITLGFSAASLPSGRTLIIDPAPALVWGTYYPQSTVARAIVDDVASDGSGNVLVTGWTYSTSGIATEGAHQTTATPTSIGMSTFITKFNAAGVRQWATYYGAYNGSYGGNSISTDGAGNVLVAGTTNSETGIASGGHLNTFYGGNQPFLVKFSPSGVRLWGTYYGIGGSTFILDVAADPSGNILVAGVVGSNSSDIVTNDAHDVTYNFTNNAFIVKFNASGQRLWGTYYGNNATFANSICTDLQGNVLVTGWADGINIDPGLVTLGAHQTTTGGGSYDAFLVKFNPSGQRLWGTYYGGSGYEGQDGSIACDASGNIIICGSTSSSNGIATANAQHPNYSGGAYAKGFFAKFNSSGSRLWGTYFDDNYGLAQSANAACDPAGNIITASYSNNNSTAYIVKYNPAGMQESQTTYGGSSGGQVRGMCTDPLGNILICGNTYSLNGIASTGAFQTTFSGGINSFIAKFTETSCTQAPSAPASITGPAVFCSGPVQFSCPAVSGATSYSWVLPSGFTSTSATNVLNLVDDNFNGFTSGTVIVKAVNSCGVSAAKTLAVSRLLPAPSSISGPASLCGLTSATYTAAAVSGATGYLWTLPSGLSGTSSTNSISVSINPTSFSGGNITVQALSGCGGNPKSLSLIKAPAAPSTLSGPTQICGLSSATYTCSAITGATSYSWVLPAGLSGTSSTNSITVAVNAALFTSGSISVQALSNCGNSASKTIALSKLPGTSASITGPTFICGLSTATYSAAAVSGASSYLWTLPSGITGTSTTSSITAAINSASFTTGSISVQAKNACGNGTIKSLTLSKIPSAPTAISGPSAAVCQGSNQTYTCTAIANAISYTWSLPSGTVINSGQGTTSISVTLPSTFVSGTVSVTASSSCGSSAAKSLAIASRTATPGTISGTSTNLCSGGTFTYSIAAVSGASTYSWTAPTGCTFSGSSSGTSVSLVVPSGFVSGTISVVANNACGASTARSLSLSGRPPAPTTISGPASVCPAATVVYSTTPVTGASSYSWTLPSGASITAGSGTSAITVNWGTVAGSVSVRAGNACGTNTTAKTLAVALATCRIAVNLPSSSLPHNEFNASVFPNPAGDFVGIDFQQEEPGDYRILISDLTGRVIMKDSQNAVVGNQTFRYSIADYPQGIYLVSIGNGKKTRVFRLVKE